MQKLFWTRQAHVAVSSLALLAGCGDPADSGALDAGGASAGGGVAGAPSVAGTGSAGASGAALGSGGNTPLAGAGSSGAASGGAGGMGGGAVGGAGSATAGAAGSGGSAGAVAVDHGDEYLWIDQEYHWDQTTDANIADHGPSNWYDDQGKNYHDGKIEFRVTIESKADSTPVWHELCHWQNSLGDNAHVCLHCLPLYTAPGEYTCETTASQQGGPVDYHKPFVAVQNRVKDGSGGRGMDLITLKKGLPIDYHYTVVLVPAGQNFSGWDKYPH